eukprot:jgi/Picre1/30570/NNA_005932.t1
MSSSKSSPSVKKEGNGSWLDGPEFRGKKIPVVTANGEKRMMSMKQLYESIERENAKVMARRGWSDKQTLSEMEERDLELQRMGGGSFDVPGGGLLSRVGAWRRSRDVAYGVYCRSDRVHEVLGKRWKGREPESVIESGTFEWDALRKCHGLDMHAMMVIMRPISLREIRPMVKKELEKRVDKLSMSHEGAQDMRADIDAFVSIFDEKVLQGSACVDGEKVKKGTHVILSSTPKAELVVETISPGPIATRRTSLIGINRNPIVTAAAFDCFVGHDAIDVGGGLTCLDGLLWCANGLETDTRTNANSQVSEIDVDGTELFDPFTGVETIALDSAGIFQRVSGTQRPKRFLHDMMRPRVTQNDE